MPRLHDPRYREAIKTRLQSIKPDAARGWGAMTVDQMMWHVARGLEQCMGRLNDGGEKVPLSIPKPVWRLIVLNAPWPKGAPAPRALLATKRYDLESERGRCLKLIDEFTARPLDGAWPVHPTMGRMSGAQLSRLQAKHINHHLTQFGA